DGIRDFHVTGVQTCALPILHDNAIQHTLRAKAWQDLLASGARPALLMEQFDREHQPDIDRVLARPGATADQVIAAGRASPNGWRSEERRVGKEGQPRRADRR